MRRMYLGGVATALAITLCTPVAQSQPSAPNESLRGTGWKCSWPDGYENFIVFYPSEGVGGGVYNEADKVTPYAIDADRTPKGEPGHWTQTGRSFTWDFPEQNISLQGEIQSGPKLVTANAERWLKDHVEKFTRIECHQTPPPVLGEGYSIPPNGRFGEPVTRADGSTRFVLKVSVRSSLPKSLQKKP